MKQTPQTSFPGINLDKFPLVMDRIMTSFSTMPPISLNTPRATSKHISPNHHTYHGKLPERLLDVKLCQNDSKTLQAAPYRSL